MAVSAAGRTLESIALDVANIAGRLRTLASGDDSWTGAAAVSAHVRTASLPPTLDKAHVSYAAAGSALGSYARTLADAQDQSTSAIAAAARASADLAAAVSAHAAAAARDASASAVAYAAGVLAPPATAPRYEASIDEAAGQLKRAVASNEDAHDQQRQAARVAASALQQASHVGIHNQSWFHHVTHSVGHWASTQWTADSARSLEDRRCRFGAGRGGRADTRRGRGLVSTVGSSGCSSRNGLARQCCGRRNGGHRTGFNRQGFVDVGRRRRSIVRTRWRRQTRHQNSAVAPRIPPDQTNAHRPREQRRSRQAPCANNPRSPTGGHR